MVKKHNNSFKALPYVLKMTRPVALGNELVLMRRFDFPAVNEIIGHDLVEGKTERGIRFFARLKEDYGVNENELARAFKKLEFNLKSLQKSISPEAIDLKDKAAILRLKRLAPGTSFWRIRQNQFYLAGFEKGKFVFVPLMDLY